MLSGVFVARLVSWCVFWKGGWPSSPSVLLSGITACCIGLRDRLRVTHLTAACVRCVFECLWRVYVAMAGAHSSSGHHRPGPSTAHPWPCWWWLCRAPPHGVQSQAMYCPITCTHARSGIVCLCVCTRVCVACRIVGCRCRCKVHNTARCFWVLIVLYSRHG